MEDNTTNSMGISLDLKPWTENGYRIVKLHMVEKLGGSLASGVLDLWHNNSDNALKLVTESQTGTIMLKNTKEGGISYEIPIFITSRNYYKNILNLEFVCIKDKSFFTIPRSTEFSDITDALNLLYPGKIDIRTESDINNEIRILQTGETDYDMCTKLAFSFKRDSVFTYGWEGFMLKELCGQSDSKGNKEPKMKIIGETMLFNTEPYNLTYDREINKSPYNPWTDTENSTTKTDYSKKELANCKVSIDFMNYNIHGTDYTQLIENSMYNKNLMNAKLYSNTKLTGTDMPNYKIGDVVEYSRASQETQYPFTKYIIASNEIFYSIDGADELSPHGLKFEWTSNLWGLDDGGWSKDENE